MDNNNKKKKRGIIILIVIAAVLALAACVCAVPVSSYLSGLNAPLHEVVSPEEVSESEVAEVTEVITDEEVEKLIKGETSLETLENDLFAKEDGEAAASSAADSTADSAAVSEPASEAESKAASASSSKAASSAASSKAASSKAESTSSSTAASSAASHTASSAASSEPAYEAQVTALVQELYVLRAQAMNDLNSCVDGARKEYKSLPEAEQTQARKVTIAFSRAGQLTKMQSYYDKEVDRIVGEMRTILTENGQSTALADEAMESYKSQKNEMYSTLMAKLYK